MTPSHDISSPINGGLPGQRDLAGLAAALRDVERVAESQVGLIGARERDAARVRRITTRLVLGLSGLASLLALWDLGLFLTAGLH